ncbi:colicin immunity domain-containing protein [Neobacillus sp. NRS-1170]|uniref:colicin immunity domain-containing protein n=1 Tax=Neobacillus sp. NRS-1170 TaxID=3233898 RepID=UPI003D28A685
MFAYKYKKLMKDFIDQVITVEDFEREYLKTFKNETERMDNTLFEILNGVLVFEAVDCYWHECLPGQETAFEISEQQLRKEVSEALDKLNSLLNNS